MKLKHNYVPPLTQSGATIDITEARYIAPGVQGFAIRLKDGRIFIPDIRADNPGNGDVGRMLDCLASRCCIVNVVSDDLGDMLKRRGYIRTLEYRANGKVDVWQRPMK